MRLCDTLKTGSEVTVDMEANVLTDHSTGQTYPLKAIGDVSGSGGERGMRSRAWCRHSALHAQPS